MENTTCKSFYYDFVVAMDSDQSLYSALTEFRKLEPAKQVLSVTYNHRFYNIHDKNYIKGLTDHFDFDHLMYSIRPSSNEVLKKNPSIDKEKFKNLSHVVLLLQSMARYEIPIGILSSKYLGAKGETSADAYTVFTQISAYFKELESLVMISNPAFNFKKKFCSLLCLDDVAEQLRNKRILFHEHFYSAAEIDMNKTFVFDYQISTLEKDLFWIGFDASYKEVPWEKPYEQTRWTQMADITTSGEPLFGKQIRYCSRCCLPETMEGISFDRFGICTPCRSSEEKMHINWEERSKNLQGIIDTFRTPTYYDCMLPMSGGKDSTFQAYVLTHRYGLEPLAVTHGTNWMSLSGRYNLENCLQQFDLDHIFFLANRRVINAVAKTSLTAIGDACWHCHIGVGTFIIQTALSWKLKLMIWGESIAERDGRGSYLNQSEASVYYNLEISGKVKAEDLNAENLNETDMSKWYFPEAEKLKHSGLRYLHLGDFIFWDEEKQVEFVVKHFEWMNSQVENAFKGYKSNECVMAGVHDYTNFIKRGVGRATVQASDDVRRGVITREEGIELAKQFDTQRPHALDFYLKLTGYTEEQFEQELLKARSLSEYAKKLIN